jgi:hypothetical protein
MWGGAVSTNLPLESLQTFPLEFLELIATLWGQAFRPAAALSGGVKRD